MWTELATAQECLRCDPPFSFFFDLVRPHWKTATQPLTLHRICTLARKQGARFVVIESALSRSDVREEIDQLDASYGGGGSAEAVAISFFACPSEPTEIEAVEPSDLLGQVVVINFRAPGKQDFENTYVYEAILSPPAFREPDSSRRPLLNNFICEEGEFRCSVKGREFNLAGIYYCQQNGRTNVCAHACLRMALNSICGAASPATTGHGINGLLGITPPFSGLSLGDIRTVIDGSNDAKASVVDCDTLALSNFLSILAAVVESGHVALLVFTTGDPQVEHVVTVFGYTRNSDEWHPEAVPAYSGGPPSTPYYPSSFWIDHFLIHDDNFGPYYAFSSRALDVDHKVRARYIIALHPVCPNVRPDYAEAATAIVLHNLIPTLVPTNPCPWFDLIKRPSTRFVLRTVLIEKSRYLEHLRRARGHDRSLMSADQIAALEAIPDWMWMVEFSLPALYTGNRSKLGEILVDGFKPPNPAQIADSLLAIRLPGLLIVRDQRGELVPRSSDLLSHSEIFLHRSHGNVW